MYLLESISHRGHSLTKIISVYKFRSYHNTIDAAPSYSEIAIYSLHTSFYLTLPYLTLHLHPQITNDPLISYLCRAQIYETSS